MNTYLKNNFFLIILPYVFRNNQPAAQATYLVHYKNRNSLGYYKPSNSNMLKNNKSYFKLHPSLYFIKNMLRKDLWSLVTLFCDAKWQPAIVL